MGGSRSDRQKSPDNVFFFYFTEVKWSILKQSIIFQGSRGGPTVSRGVQLSPGGGGSNCLFPIETAIFDKSAHQDPHFVSRSNGSFSRHNTARRPGGGGGYSDLFFINSRAPHLPFTQKHIRNFKHPPKYSSYPPKILNFLKIKKMLQFKMLSPIEWPKPTYV